jgi:diguanylate cyclase (GGDEF)-like protein
MPELMPFAEAFNLALTGEDDEGTLATQCDALRHNQLEPEIVLRMTTTLAVTFADEVRPTGTAMKGLVTTLGHVCGLLTSGMVADERRIARLDPLTALESRRAWDEAVADDAARGQWVVVAVLDLDGFKQINDGHGHAAGDEYLKRFGRELTVALPPDARTFRVGGDEFAVRWLGGSEAGMVDRLRALADREGVALFSFGVAAGIPDAGDSEGLFKVADEALYAMKEEHESPSPEARSSATASIAEIDADPDTEVGSDGPGDNPPAGADEHQPPPRDP